MLIVEHTPVDQTLRELNPVGTDTFPMTIYYTDLRKHTGGFVNWHWHTELQFCLVTHGRVDFFVNHDHYVLGEADGVFVNSEAIHMARADPELGGGYLCLDVAPRLLSLFARSVFEERYVAPYVGKGFLESVPLYNSQAWQHDLLSHMPQIAELCDKKPFGYEYEVQTRICRMWVEMISRSNRKQYDAYGAGTQNVALVRNIISHLCQHYSERITLQSIAANVHKSPGECSRIFKKTTNSTIFDYLEGYRIEQAAQLLRTSSLSVESIGAACGFGTASYFIKVFKKNMGQTPLDYRRYGAK